MRLLTLLSLLLLSLSACSPAPADVPDEPPAAPVRLETVKWQPFQPTLALLGVVQPSGFAEVAIPVSGRLDYPGRFGSGLVTGAAVREGEVLARITSHDSEAELAEARLRVELTSSELARHQRAFDSGVEAAAVLASYKAEADIARGRLEAAQGRAGRLSLRSPVSGRLIVDHRIPPDSEVAPGTILVRVAAGGSLKVEGRAAAADRGRLHPGLKVRFVAPDSEKISGAGGEGIIREVSPVVEAGGTVPLIVEVTDPEGLPAPGEGVELWVELDARSQAVTVPEEALVVAESGSAVFVVERKMGLVARRRPVETGARGGGRVEVVRGLDPGEKLVVSGASLIEDGDQVLEVKDAPK
ncbi:MAG TPA: efflux RND transporter periplasmic adaptor subunit [Thermoanaerobaculia bacterium]|nr:efflux RND transporter periplasmic adaptor subunit [Thermoanaerobaculia bacterium]